MYSSKNRPLKYETASPGRLVRDAIALFKEKAAVLNIRLREQVNPQLPEIKVDIASVRQMLHNLIWNGLQACLNDEQKKNHFVSVKTDIYDDAHFFFEIADNGIGMDQITLRKIFEEFFSTKGSGGTGWFQYAGLWALARSRAVTCPSRLTSARGLTPATDRSLFQDPGL